MKMHHGRPADCSPHWPPLAQVCTASQPGFTASAPAKPGANTSRCRLILPRIHAVVGREANPISMTPFCHELAQPSMSPATRMQQEGAGPSCPRQRIRRAS